MFLRFGLALTLICSLFVSPLWASDVRQELAQQSTLEKVISKN